MRMADDDEETRQIGEPAGALAERLGAGMHERRPQQQILGRVTAQAELGREDEAGAFAVGTSRRVDDLLRVAGEVADAGVDLRQRHFDWRND